MRTNWFILEHMKRPVPPRASSRLRSRLLRAIHLGRRARPLDVRPLGAVPGDAGTPRPSLLLRVFSPGWENLVPAVSGEDGVSRAKALEWELVLQSRHLPCRLGRLRSGELWSVAVQPWFLDRAVSELQLYIDENRAAPQPPMLPPPRPGELWPTLLLMLAMTVFFAWYTSPHPALNLFAPRWLAAGSAHSGAILSGQWYRLVTALTLHADGPHLVGNAVIGGAFIMLACRVLGSGLAWLLVMAAGVGGNLFNALVQKPTHDSIGFSTAVFGAAGVLAGVRMAEGGGGVTRVLVPVGAGLGLLAMLGTGGENTDLGAHLFGFLAGLALGLPAGWLAVRKGRPGRVPGAIMLLLTAGLPVVCWVLAFS